MELVSRREVNALSLKNYAYISPEMLKWARSETPFCDLADVAARTQIDIEELLNWESGQSLPSITNAKKLAYLYDVPLACFYLSCPPARKPRPYVDRRTPAGIYGKSLSYNLWREIRNTMFNREVAVELMGDDIKTFTTIPIVKATDSVEVTAAAIRDFLGMKTSFLYKNEYGYNAYNYFRDIIEKKGIMVTQLVGIERDEIRALSIYFDTMPIISINGKDWERSKVFSLFHEIAHLIRRSSSLCSIAFDEYDDAEEMICNSIAAATLLPEAEFRRLSSKFFLVYNDWSNSCLAKLADSFGTSTSVVLRRLFSLSVIKPDYFYKRLSELKEEFENSGAENKNAFCPDYYYKYLNKEGRLFPRVVLSAYSRGLLSYGEMCQTLNLSSAHIGNVEQAVMYS